VLEGILVGIIDASLLRKAMQSSSGVDSSPCSGEVDAKARKKDAAAVGVLVDEDDTGDLEGGDRLRLRGKRAAIGFPFDGRRDLAEASKGRAAPLVGRTRW
jgi:hypothetical protein